MNYLLDTNIVSETVKTKANKALVQWLETIPNTSLYLSVITLGEIRKGIEKLGNSPKKNQLLIWLENDLRNDFQERIINIDFNVAEKWGFISAHYKNIHAIDALIAATALSYNLKLVTRNTKDFQNISNLEIVNPFLC